MSNVFDVAFISHGYHFKTKSNRVLHDFLSKSAIVKSFYDSSLIDGDKLDLGQTDWSEFDLIVVWQMEYIAQWFALSFPEKLVFVPMYDGARNLGEDFWQSFRNSRILNFSYALHERVQLYKVPSLLMRYYPDPSKVAPVSFDGLRAFLWQRGPDIGWRLAKRLLAAGNIDSFRMHLAADPGHAQLALPSEAEQKIFNISFSEWSEDHSAVNEALASANIYIAPRPYEGIGLSFLEAMAMGHCVIAHDAPTMSEYITHGVSGMLYNSNRPVALDLSAAATIGCAARRSVEYGFAQWQHDCQMLLPNFLLHGRDQGLSVVSRTKYANRSNVRTKSSGTNNPHFRPLISIATVTLNAKDDLIKTIRSVSSQDYANKEFIIIDGGSTDGTLDFIQENSNAISCWISEPDAGPFDAMNKASRLAQGEYIVFINAGDYFGSDDALSAAIANVDAKAAPDFIFGHHFYIKDGHEQFHKAADFENTWRALREGRFWFKYLFGVPCHQATLTRTSMLRENLYDLSWKIAADHEFLYRMRVKKAKFFNCDRLLAVYQGDGMSAQNEAICHEEWRRLVEIYGDPTTTDRLLRSEDDLPPMQNIETEPQVLAKSEEPDLGGAENVLLQPGAHRLAERHEKEVSGGLGILSSFFTSIRRLRAKSARDDVE